jgi:hypothetical protein
VEDSSSKFGIDWKNLAQAPQGSRFRANPYLPPRQRMAMEELADDMGCTLDSYEDWRFFKARLCLAWRIDAERVDGEMHRRGLPAVMGCWVARGNWADEENLAADDVARQPRPGQAQGDSAGAPRNLAKGAKEVQP